MEDKYKILLLSVRGSYNVG